MQFDSTNYINTWNNSSVLQGQFPDVNDYIDLFRSSYTPFTSSTSSTPSTSSESGVGSLMEPKIINTDDSGDQGTPPGGNTNAGYGYSGVGGFSLADIAEGTVAAKDQTLSMKVDDAITGAKATFNNIGPGAKAIGSGLLSFMTKSPFSPIGVINYGYKFAKENVNRIQEEKAAAEAAAEAAKIESIRSFYDSFGRDYGQGRATQSAMDSYGTDPETGNPGNYDQDNDMKDGGRVGFADGGMTESSGIYGLLRRGIKNIEDGGYIDGSNRRKDFEIGGPVGQERKLTDYIEPNIKAQTGSSTPVPGVNIDQESYEYILKLKIPLDEKLKLIAEFGGNKSITEIDDSELASRYGVKKGADIYKGGSSNKRFGAEYINDGLTFGGRYDPDSGNKNLYISKRFQDGGLATMFKLK